MSATSEGASPFWESLEVLDGQHWISRDFKGRGEFEFSGNLRISGQWTGMIFSKSPDAQLHVLKSASLTGSIRVERVTVEGDLKDIDIEAEWLRVLPGAHVSGRVRAKTLIIEDGAIVEGRIVAESRA